MGHTFPRQANPTLRIVRYYPRACAGDGGMTGAVRHWSRGLAQAGAEVVLAFDGSGGSILADSIQWRAVRHIGRGKLRMPVSLEPVLLGADLLILHSAWSTHNLLAAAAARRAGVPYILEPRGAYDPHIVRRRGALKRVWWRAWEEQLVARALAVHIFFDAERSHLDALGYRGPVIVATNGVEVSDGVSWNGGSGGYLLWLGRFDPEHKGLDLLVRALAHLSPKERPKLRLHGPDFHGGRAVVARLVRSLGLESWVTCGEPVYGAAKLSLLSRCAGFVYPSRWEGFGNSVAESVALGVPTLVTPYPLGRYLADRRGAILADPTVASLADGVRRLLSSDASTVGRQGALIVREEFAWERVVPCWLSQVQALL